MSIFPLVTLDRVAVVRQSEVAMGSLVWSCECVCCQTMTAERKSHV